MSRPAAAATKPGTRGPALNGSRPFVYILRCADGSLYTGIAKDLPRRLAQHATGRASRYTRGRLPVTLVWSRRVRSWRDALRTEARIKALRRREKDALVQDERRCRCAGAIADALPSGDPAARHPVHRAREDTDATWSRRAPTAPATPGLARGVRAKGL